MELRRVQLENSPVAGRVRVSGRVEYDDGQSEDYWFDFPAHVASQLSTSGSPWLACLLPLAATLREPLRLHAPVDPMLLAGAHELLRVWNSWYGDIPQIRIDAPIASADSAGTREASFFSGGVDSFFTLLRSRENAAPGGRIDDVITVIGFDVPVAARAAGERLRARHAAIAEELGVGFLAVETNLRTTRWSAASWERVAHGPGLSAIALLLEPRFHTVRIAATGGYRDLHPWASHPLTDPLLSTTRTTLVHDGAAWSRTDKTRLLARHEIALRNLRVCWRSESDTNCGSCNKCYRTMLILELLGALERCDAFRSSTLDLDRAARVHCAYPWDFREFEDIRRLAVSLGRNDVARAAVRAMRSSRRLNGGLGLLRRSRWLGDLARSAERRMLRSRIV